jgi:replication initiation protein RepC
MKVSTGGRQLSHAALAAAQLTLAEPEVSRQELSAAARNAMKALELRPGERLVLSEIVGCWGEVLISDRILIWPSNEYLVERTGLSERAVRYAVQGLVRASVLIPKDSANGKRFAIKGRGGVVLDAFGFDLTPIYARRNEWLDRVQAQRDARNARRRVFDEITICRRASEAALSALAESDPCYARSDVQEQLEALARRTPRRNVTVDMELLRDLCEAWRLLRSSAERLFFQTGNGGKSCSLIESGTHSFSEPMQQETAEVEGRVEWYAPPPEHLSLKLILEACPALFNYTDPIDSERSLIEAGRYLRSSLGAHESSWFEAVEKIGHLRAAVAVAITLQLHEDDQAGKRRARILNPGGYFRRLVRLIHDGRVELEVELMKLRRERL